MIFVYTNHYISVVTCYIQGRFNQLFLPLVYDTLFCSKVEELGCEILLLSPDPLSLDMALTRCLPDVGLEQSQCMCGL